MLLARCARTPLPRAPSWVHALVSQRVTTLGVTAALRLTRAAVAWKPTGVLTFATSSQTTAPSRKQKGPPKPSARKGPAKATAKATKGSAKGAPSDASWRQPLQEFERRIDLHGAAAAYSAADIHALVQTCADHGRHREAQSVLHRARSLGISPTPATLALVCGLHARKGNVDAALDALQDVLRDARDPKLVDPLLTVLKDQHDWQSVRRAVQLMHELEIDVPVRVFRVLLIAAAKARRKDIVHKTVAFIETKFQREPVDVATLTAMCQALTDVGDTRAVLDRYHTMDQQWLETHGNTILFNNFVRAALVGNRVTKALEIFDRMNVSSTFAPDDFTFATLMLELEKRGEWDHVIRLFNDILERELKGLSHTRAINALSCAAVVRALHSREGEGGRAANDRSMRVVRSRLDRIDVRHFGHAASLVDALETHGFRADAQKLFTRMVSANVITTPWRRQDGFEIDLHSFSRGVAKCAVVYAFQQVRGNAAIQKTDDMRIITGVGKRSRAFLEPVVPDDITDVLKRSFRPLIHPMAHPTNPGVLLIRSKFIREWLDGGAEIRHFE